MLDKLTIERILKANGVTKDAPEEEVRSVLVAARWHEHDIQTAIAVLNETYVAPVNTADQKQTVFGDSKLRPETISSLLGLETTITMNKKRSEASSYGKRSHLVLSIIILSVVIAAIVLVGTMWYLDMGFFHSSIKG